MSTLVTTGMFDPHGDREERKAATLRMLEEWTPDGEQPSVPLIRRAAEAAGATPSTVKRWWENRHAERTPKTTKGWVAGDPEVELFFAAKGSYARAHRLLEREQPETTIEVATLRRGIKRRLSPAQIAAAAYGYKGFKALSLTITNPDGELHRNQLWEIDTVELPFRVVMPRGSRPSRARLVVVLDGGTRGVPGWALVAGRPVNRGDVLAALGSAIRPNPERGPFHGVPSFLRCDNGLDYLSRDVAEVALALNITLAPTAPYTPEHKGKIERFFRTFQESLALEVPGSVEGARNKRGELYDCNELFSVPELAAAITDVVDAYNDRPHSALNGRTPRQAWDEDATPLRVIPEEDLYWMLLAAGKRTIVRQGIRFGNRWYIAPELTGCITETVEIYYLPSDLRTIEVYRGGKHLCTALDSALASNEFKRELIWIRENEKRTVEKIQKRTNRANRARNAHYKSDAAEVREIETQATGLAPITDPARIEETTRHAPQKTLRRIRGYRQNHAAAAGQRSLLGGGRSNRAWKRPTTPTTPRQTSKRKKKTT